MAGELDSRPDRESAAWHSVTVGSVLSALLCIFVLVDVNYPSLSPQSQLAIFGSLGLVYCFVTSRTAFLRPWLDSAVHTPLSAVRWIHRGADRGLVLAVVAAGASLGSRIRNPRLDLFIGWWDCCWFWKPLDGAWAWPCRRSHSVFLAYCFLGPYLPSWLLPHRGYSLDRVVSQVFLQSQGVFGIALRVMFTYVHCVVFGVLLELTAVTAFVLIWPGGSFLAAAVRRKIAVVASGLMGSLSGSANLPTRRRRAPLRFHL